jgi:hypothetical protein
MTMALNANDKPYVAYQDQANGFAESCMMYNGTSWVHVGAATFSVAQVQFSHIVFDNTGLVPYICYNTGYNPFAPNVQMYTGGAWSYVGGQNLNTNVDYQNNLALDGNNIPYVIFPDGALSSKATVMYYNGASWLNAGNTGFSAGAISYPNIATDLLNNVYVEYYDAANMLSVMELDVSTAVKEISDATNNLSVYPNPSNGNVIISFGKTISNAKIKLINAMGQTVSEKQNQSGNQFALDISNYASGIYYVEVQQSDKVWRTKIVKE